MKSVTRPVSLSTASRTAVLSMIEVMAKLLSPGTRVMSRMLEFPTTPPEVERVRVTLPNAMVMTDGLGTNAVPKKLEVPLAAVMLILAFVTLNPFNPLRALSVSKYPTVESTWEHTLVGRGGIVVDMSDRKVTLMKICVSN